MHLLANFLIVDLVLIDKSLDYVFKETTNYFAIVHIFLNILSFL